MSTLTTVIIWTIAVYAAYALAFGGELFDTDFAIEDDAGFLDTITGFFTDTFELLGDLIQFILLTKIATEVSPLFYAFFVLGLGLPWLYLIVRGPT